VFVLAFAAVVTLALVLPVTFLAAFTEVFAVFAVSALTVSDVLDTRSKELRVETSMLLFIDAFSAALLCSDSVFADEPALTPAEAR
jgi:hypothetical protein